jgi:hypothetical protein
VSSSQLFAHPRVEIFYVSVSHRAICLPICSDPPFQPQQPQIVLLREGTDTSQGKGQLISNINACMAVVDSIRTTLVRRPCCWASRLAVPRSPTRLPPAFSISYFADPWEPSDRTGPARVGQARARRQRRDHDFQRRRDYHEGTGNFSCRRSPTATEAKRTTPPIGNRKNRHCKKDDCRVKKTHHAFLNCFFQFHSSRPRASCLPATHPFSSLVFLLLFFPLLVTLNPQPPTLNPKKLLDIVHPAAKSLVDIARSQDSEVGDGTTTVVILAGEFLRECKPFVEDGVHPMNIIKSFREAARLAIDKVKSLAVSIEGKDAAEKADLLKKCAMTTLSSKLVGGEKEFFADMCVNAVMSLDQDLLDPRMIGVKKVMGGAMRDSFLVDGVAFKKTFSYAG